MAASRWDANLPNISRRGANENPESAFFSNPGVDGVVVVSNRILVQAQCDVSGLARGQEDLLECHELLFWSWQPGLFVVDVHLDSFGPVDRTDVANAHDNVDSAVGRKRALLEFGSTVFEGCIREAVPESEKGIDLASFVVAVADINSFAVQDLQVLARPGVIRRSILDSLRESALWNHLVRLLLLNL